MFSWMLNQDDKDEDGSNQDSSNDNNVNNNDEQSATSAGEESSKGDDDGNIDSDNESEGEGNNESEGEFEDKKPAASEAPKQPKTLDDDEDDFEDKKPAAREISQNPKKLDDDSDDEDDFEDKKPAAIPEASMREELQKMKLHLKKLKDIVSQKDLELEELYYEMENKRHGIDEIEWKVGDVERMVAESIEISRKDANDQIEDKAIGSKKRRIKRSSEGDEEPAALVDDDKYDHEEEKVVALPRGKIYDLGGADIDERNYDRDKRKKPALPSGKVYDLGGADVDEGDHDRDEQKMPALPSGKVYDLGGADVDEGDHDRDEQKMPALPSGKVYDLGGADVDEGDHDRDEQKMPALPSGKVYDLGGADADEENRNRNELKMPALPSGEVNDLGAAGKSKRPGLVRAGSSKKAIEPNRRSKMKQFKSKSKSRRGGLGRMVKKEGRSRKRVRKSPKPETKSPRRRDHDLVENDENDGRDETLPGYLMGGHENDDMEDFLPGNRISDDENDSLEEFLPGYLNSNDEDKGKEEFLVNPRGGIGLNDDDSKEDFLPGFDDDDENDEKEEFLANPRSRLDLGNSENDDKEEFLVNPRVKFDLENSENDGKEEFLTNPRRGGFGLDDRENNDREEGFSQKTRFVGFDFEENDDVYNDDIDEENPIVKPRRGGFTGRLTNRLTGFRFSTNFAAFIEEIIGDDDQYKHNKPMIPFEEDTFSLMMTNPVRSIEWVVALIAVSFQWLILTLIFIDLVTGSTTSTLNIPYSVAPSVSIGQFLSIFLCVGVQSDVLSSSRTLGALWAAEDWDAVIGEEGRGTREMFIVRIVMPNVMKFISGCLVLSVNFVTVVQSDNIVDLMKDVAALVVISEITNVTFRLGGLGFLGQALEESARVVGETEVEDPFSARNKGCRLFNLRLLVFCFLVAGMGITVSIFLRDQQNGNFLKMTYPNCDIDYEESIKLNNGKCDGGVLNTIACGFDDGDCLSFNLAYPSCNAAEPWRVGDETCDEQYNTPECDYDGSDCCPYSIGNGTLQDRLGDGICDGGQFSTKKCQYDDFDCNDMRSNYPLCELEVLANQVINTANPPRLGNNVCDSKIYNTEECGYENGDCATCNNLVHDFALTGDGVCHGGYHNSEECNFDAGDCDAFNLNYPRCEAVAARTEKMVAIPIIGDKICNSGLYNNPDCGYEDGDCVLCNELIENITKIGDGVCDGQNYMSDICGRDGGDCSACIAPRFEIGDGWCQQEHNTAECGYDGGDCLSDKYPNCTDSNVLLTLLGNGYCNGDLYNTSECEYDGGDCLIEIVSNTTASNCSVPVPSLLGDGVCHGGNYNTEACDFDNGDCEDFNERFPNFSEDYPNCTLDNLQIEINDFNLDTIGDGWCTETYDNEQCGFDAGDC